MWEGHQQHRPRTCRPLAPCHSSISPEVGWGGGNRGWGFLREQTADYDPPPSVAEPLLRPLPVTGWRGPAGSALVTQRMLGPSQLVPGRESCWFLSIALPQHTRTDEAPFDARLLPAKAISPVQRLHSKNIIVPSIRG